MRYIFTAIIIILLASIIKTDMTNGTISLANLSVKAACTPTNTSPSYIAVEVTEGDQLVSLFSLYSSTDYTMVERVQAFYELNPALRKQALQPGTTVKIPIDSHYFSSCN